MDSAPSDGDCYIDDLPDEIFAWILNLLPIKLVIRCSIVSKRWDAACRYLIRTCGSLSIGNDSYRPDDDVAQGWGWFWERPSVRLGSTRSLVPAMMKSLNQMEDLTRLCVIDQSLRRAHISPFIRKFTEQLTMLEIDFAISKIGADAFPHLNRLRCRYFDAKSSSAFPKLAELMIMEVNNVKLPNMRLPSLKKLLIAKSYSEDDAELIRGFILANAENLTFLKIFDSSLRLDHAVFPNLKQLYCPHQCIAGECPLPALTHLSVKRSGTAELLTSLPADQMLCLEVYIYRDEENVVSAISRMRNLKRLKLTCEKCNEQPNTLSSIMDNMCFLEEVELVFRDCRINQDNMIATLANQNPMLWYFHAENVVLTDAAPTSLAQLQHLTDVRIHRSKKVTMAGALTLLRGASRSNIRKYSVDRKQKSSRCLIESEIRQMCEERSTRFHSSGGRFSHTYDIHDICN